MWTPPPPYLSVLPMHLAISVWHDFCATQLQDKTTSMLIHTSSFRSMASPSGRNWKVSIVKRRVWPRGEESWGSDSTACFRAGSKGLGHLGVGISKLASQLPSKHMIYVWIYTPLMVKKPTQNCVLTIVYLPLPSFTILIHTEHMSTYPL